MNKLYNEMEKIRKVRLEAEEKERQAKKEAEEKGKQIEILEKELKSFRKGVDFSNYRGSIDNLQIELAMFGAWANIIKEAESFSDRDVKRLTSQLKSKVKRAQIREFPKMRKEYANIVANKMWEHNVYIRASGGGNRYINLTASFFASNKNIQDIQTKLYSAMNMFRFTQSRYRWYKGASEFTYYKIYEGKDSDLVVFEK